MVKISLVSILSSASTTYRPHFLHVSTLAESNICLAIQPQGIRLLQKLLVVQRRNLCFRTLQAYIRTLLSPYMSMWSVSRTDTDCGKTNGYEVDPPDGKVLPELK